MGVEIQLTDRYWLVSDRYSWALAVRKRYRDKATGELAYRLDMQTWHPTIGDACQACFQLELRQCDADSLKALAEYAEQARERLLQATQGIDQLSPSRVNEESVT